MQRLIKSILSWGLSLLITLAGLTLVLTNLAHAEPLVSNGAIASSTQPSARDIFQDAYDSRYTWDAKFPGYQAEVSLKYNGDLYHGLVQVNPDWSVSVKNIENEEMRQLVENQLKMETIHRRPVSFANRHEQDSYQLEGTDASGAAKIREIGNQSESHYKVKDRKIIQVNRRLGDTAVTVNSLGFITPPEGYLVSHFQSTFFNPQTGDVLAIQDVQDFHEKIGNYYLLTNRTIQTAEPGATEPTQKEEVSMRFNDIQALS